MLQLPDFLHRGKILRHLPRIEKRLDEVRLPGESIANLFERDNLLRKRIFLLPQHVPFRLRLRIRIIAHHLHQVSVELLVKRERRARVLLAGLRRIQEVMPETERRPIHIFALERAIHAFFGRERSAA